MQKSLIVEVQGVVINVVKMNQDEYISLTDIARYKGDRKDLIIQNRMRNRNTLEFLGLREKINNPNFKPLEFEGFKKEVGLNAFLMSPQKWVKGVNAIGMIIKSGRYGGGTFAHKDIAIEFANWISVEFKLYLIKEFQRLKEQEVSALDRNVKRFLTKMNYKIHTDAIKENLIPKELSQEEMNCIYADEADVLNKSLFGLTAKQRKNNNSQKKGNIRDYATIEQLIILANIESMNAQFIAMGIRQSERLQLLNKTAIIQMKSLVEDNMKLRFESKNGRHK